MITVEFARALRRLARLALGAAVCPVPLQAETLSERLLSCASAYEVTRLADLTGLDHLGIPVWAAYRPNGFVLSLAGGKGLTHEQARLSAQFEAVEHDAAERHLGAKSASAEDMALHYRTERLFKVDECARYVPPSSAGAAPLRWSLGVNLMDARLMWVPTELVALDDRRASRATEPGGWITGAGDISSTGLAAARTYADAVRHALFELIEEDATAIWRYGSPGDDGPVALDPASLNAAELPQLLARISRAGASCRFFNATSADIGIPTIYAVIGGRYVEGEPEWLLGAGACSATSFADAATGAVLEAAQSRLSFISGARDDLTPARYAAMTQRRNGKGLLSASERDRPNALRGGSEALAADHGLSEALSRLAAAGVTQIVAVPLSSPVCNELGIAVVRLVANKLEADFDVTARQLGSRGLFAILNNALSA